MRRVRLFPKILLLLFLLASLVPTAAVASSNANETENDDPFVMPRGLERAVDFWIKIFTEYDSTQLVFFNPYSFQIYDVMTQPERTRKSKRVRYHKRAIQRNRGLVSDQIRVQRGVADHFAAGVARSGRYMPHMREVFAEEGLPEELTYLPLVESSFRMDARSFVGAVGIWQFMPATGRRFMRVTRELDERKDPWEATRAAARLLRQNYRALGTWPLAVTAYNHGQAGMARAVRAVGSTDLAAIIERYRGRTFGFASKNFYAEFLAAVYVMRKIDRYYPGIEFDEPLEVRELPLSKYVPVAALLRYSGVSQAELLEWNPALSHRARWLPKGYRLKVTPDTENSVRSSLQRIVEMPWIPHQVSRGETLSRIAARYGTTVSDIQVVNGLKSVHRLRIGQELKIPPAKSRVARRTKGRSGWRYHRVRRGESLWVIARRYRVSVAMLRRDNGISKRDKIQPGDRLKIRRDAS